MLILTCIAFVFLGITAAMGSMMAWVLLSFVIVGGIARDLGVPTTLTPNRRTQVPEWYRDAFSQEVTATLFGVLLRETVLTYFSMSASLTVLAMAPFFGALPAVWCDLRVRAVSLDRAYSCQPTAVDRRHNPRGALVNSQIQNTASREWNSVAPHHCHRRHCSSDVGWSN